MKFMNQFPKISLFSSLLFFLFPFLSFVLTLSLTHTHTSTLKSNMKKHKYKTWKRWLMKYEKSQFDCVITKHFKLCFNERNSIVVLLYCNTMQTTRVTVLSTPLLSFLCKKPLSIPSQLLSPAHLGHSSIVCISGMFSLLII